MRNEIIDKELLISALSNTWKTAAQIKEELGIPASSKKIGQAFRNLIKDNPDIETEKHKHILYYRIVVPALRKGVISSIARPSDVKKESLEIAQYLKDHGIDPQMICYNALKAKKDEYEEQHKLLLEQLPLIAERDQKLIDRIKDLENQLQDLKDMKQKKESLEMVKRVSEERKVKSGLL